ncbi:prophage antirepressor [Pseudomonas sp. M47T1]|uniref:BRO-N domain-containing protein n=1 Tax=Pseudomonas sp. M47T1 TaxID=1179778 RepID=UPI0002607DFC|nr:BRO family protein [Pseudomonas sp. M47T1]EIK94033.1 prophage antirepressor [Pseudomonas sp. M47T1]
MNMIPFDFNGTLVTVFTDEHGEPWFIALELAGILGYSDAFELTKKLDDDEKQNRQIAGFGPRGVSTINEPGLYSAILNSSKPEAKRFKRWVTHDVLPTIRKTGYYQKPMTQAELIAASANILVSIERQQAQQQVALERVERRVEDLSQTSVWDHCPQNCQSLTRIKETMLARHGLSGAVVDFVLKQWPNQPNPAGMVRNGHEEALGSQYLVWSKSHVTAAFHRFVGESTMVSPTQATHPYFEGRFRLVQKAKP